MPEYLVRPMPPQIAPALTAKFARVETATIGHSRHWGIMDGGIRPLLRGARVAGTAVTLAIPAQDSTLLHHAMGLLRPGDFLVIDRLGDDKHACWGGGVSVSPGDLILADESGVVALTPHDLEAIADAALARQERTERNQARMRAGEKLGDISGATKMVLDALKAGA